MLATLKRIHDETGQNGHGWLTAEEFQATGKHFNAEPQSLFSLNMQVKDGEKVAARLSDVGLKLYHSIASQAAPATTYKLEDDVPVPTRENKGGLKPRKSIYPLETMKVKQSFLETKRDDEDNPVRRMGSIVSSANRRLEPKVFEVYPEGDNARIFRMPDRTTPLPPPKPRKAKGSAPAATAATGATGGGFGQSAFEAPAGGAFAVPHANGFGGGAFEQAASEAQGFVPPGGFGGEVDEDVTEE